MRNVKENVKEFVFVSVAFFSPHLLVVTKSKNGGTSHSFGSSRSRRRWVSETGGMSC
jgi:hypothetical protein